jgi:hypothetical protein
MLSCLCCCCAALLHAACVCISVGPGLWRSRLAVAAARGRAAARRAHPRQRLRAPPRVLRPGAQPAPQQRAETAGCNAVVVWYHQLAGGQQLPACCMQCHDALARQSPPAALASYSKHAGGPGRAILPRRPNKANLSTPTQTLRGRLHQPSGGGRAGRPGSPAAALAGARPPDPRTSTGSPLLELFLLVVHAYCTRLSSRCARAAAPAPLLPESITATQKHSLCVSLTHTNRTRTHTAHTHTQTCTLNTRRQPHTLPTPGASENTSTTRQTVPSHRGQRAHAADSPQSPSSSAQHRGRSPGAGCGGRCCGLRYIGLQGPG